MGQTQARTATAMRRRRRRRRGGFTLTELLVVIVIIGIIISLILVATAEANRRAQEASTQSLIVKLESALNDRLDALLQLRPSYNAAHRYLAGVYPASMTPPVIEQLSRAQVIAWYDFIKSELPDVFFVQNLNPGNSTPYPLNFAGNPYPGVPLDGLGLGNYILPLGNCVGNDNTTTFGANNLLNLYGTGIFGASYSAAAGIYKNLGYLPAGYDGVDNNLNGYIDDWGEGVNATNSGTVLAHLAAHQHHTARAEMLYAVLVEGTGPLGASFSRDEFTDSQVKDTDGDGLPEFVDAWGQPLQFFRWPILYHTDTQRGQVINTWNYTTSPVSTYPNEVFQAPYASAFEYREINPLDPNNQLLAPAWWLGSQNSNYLYGAVGYQLPGSATQAGIGGSFGANAFEYFFHRLTEPLEHTGNASFYWDRGLPVSGFGYRRAFFSRPLILSGGFDQTPGVYLTPDGPSINATTLITTDNNAMPFVPSEVFTTGGGYFIPAGTAVTPTTQYSQALRDFGRDDITNQTRTAEGGTGGS